MLTIPGFEINDVIYENGQTAFYHGTRKKDKQPVVLKLLAGDFPDVSDIKKLKREFEIGSSVEGAGLMKMFAVDNSGRSAAIVMEDFDGILLSRFLTEHSLTVEQFLVVAIQLATILNDLHSREIIHKNFNPSNFLIHPQTLTIKLIDFSIAMLLTQEVVGIVNHRDIEGSLPYISPEQTGRTNRPVDYRSDFYSLGVMLYEMLMHRLPFLSSDPVELVHAHIARKIIPPSSLDPAIPTVISAIVTKLLEKAPEQRYKAAKGLKSDLETCYRFMQEDGIITPFNIAQHDTSNRFFISPKLYGRDNEIGRLQATFDDISKGDAAMVMVSGFSGIGKSTLIEEIHKSVVDKGGFFISGKYDQFHRDIPYSAGISAFRSLVRQLLSEADEIIAYWKQKILHALGANAQIIINVIPELELIIGRQPDVIPLPPAETINRVNLMFVTFIQLFGSREHPLVIFLDDLQWADIPTLKLIKLLMTDKETSYFMLVGTYRDNEVDAVHPLQQMINECRELNCDMQEITLRQLPFEDLNQLVADTLSSNSSGCTELSELILDKTGGNPFFVNEFLKSLHRQKLVRFDEKADVWVWNLSQIINLDMTANVVELMVDKIRQLDKRAQTLCMYASCIGSHFDLQTLSAIYEKSLQETASDLWPAIHEGLIQPIGNTYRLAELTQTADEAEAIQYRFLHDRVQQASYALVEEENKRALHLRIGRLVKKNFSEEKKTEQIFDLMNHLNFGAPLMVDDEEKLETATLNLYAGKRAKLSAAYDPAYKFLLAGIEILPPGSWETHYHFSLDLYNEGAEAAYLGGYFTDMERLTSILFRQAKNIEDKLKAYRTKVNAYVSLARNEEAFRTGEECLRALGVTFPSNPNQLHILASLVRCKLGLRNKPADYLLSLPEMKDTHQAAIMEILSDIAQPCYFAKKNLFPLIVFRQINMSVKYGNHIHTAFAYATYGIIMCGSTFEFDEGLKYGNLAVGLVNKFEAVLLAAKVHFINGNFIQNWRSHYSHNLPEIRESYHKGLETGDFLFASYAAFNYCVLNFFMDTPLPDLIVEMEAYALSLQKVKQDLGLRWLNTFIQTTDLLLNPGTSDVVLSGKYYNEEGDKKLQENTFDYTGICVYDTSKMVLCHMFNRPAEVIAFAEDAFTVVDNVLAWPHIIFIQTLYALSLLSVAKNKRGYARTAMLYKASRMLGKIAKAAKSAPDNHSAKLYLIQAEFNRFKKKNTEAAALYDKAIAAAANSRFMLEEAIANEQAAQFYIENEDADTGRKYLFEARRIYLKWGAVAKVNLLDKQHGITAKQPLERAQKSAADLTRRAYDMPDKQTHGELDINSLMKASLAISGEILLDKLVSRLMSVVIENAGAQNGYLLIKKGGNWFIEGASSTADNDGDETAAIPLQNNKLVPEPVVKYVARTKEDLVIENISADEMFAGDPVVQNKQILSVLCLPILNQGQLIGILYMENNLYTGVFTPQRIQFFKLLSGQIAVSLENALLYQSLEVKVKERTNELEKQKDALEKEKQKSDRLLLNILPAETAEELKASGIARPKFFSNISVMFTDFVNFTGTSERLNASQLVQEINFYYSAFDDIITNHNLEKIKTIGDSYMCAGGLPVANETHATDILKASMEIQQFVAVSNIERRKKGLPVFECRIGIHSGPVVAGIVGIKKFAYDIWGDTVNIASRMESGCETGKINVSGSTYEQVKDHFGCTYRGKMEAKNKGLIDMYFLNMEKENPIFSPSGAEHFIREKLKRELSPELTYHGFHHTEDVLDAAMQIADAEELSEADKQLLRIAVLFHDSGFTGSYKDHEARGCELANEVLPAFGFDSNDISVICGMITATKIPQRPQTELEKVICDADLDYLGREDFYTIGSTLFTEFKTFGIVSNEKEWDELQIRFLESHAYHTDFSKQNRAPQKQKQLAVLKDKYK